MGEVSLQENALGPRPRSGITLEPLVILLVDLIIQSLSGHAYMGPVPGSTSKDLAHSKTSPTFKHLDFDIV